MGNMQFSALRGSVANGDVTVAGGAIKINDSARVYGKKLMKRIGAKPVEIVGGDIMAYDLTLLQTSNPDAYKALLLETARKIAGQKYEEVGGLKSELGQALGGQISMSEQGGVYVADFRGGRIEVHGLTPDMNWSGTAKAEAKYRAEVWLMGLRCNVDQEIGTDEIYGTIGAYAPSANGMTVTKFPPDAPYWEIDAGDFIGQASVVYSGPPTDVAIFINLIENDSGDTTEIKKKLAEKLMEVIGAAATSAGGPSAEAAVKDDTIVNTLTLGLVNVIMDDILGAGDDPYLPQVFYFGWEDLRKNGVMRHRTPNNSPYTHAVVVSGTDDAGDRGEFTFYFDVRVFEETRII